MKLRSIISLAICSALIGCGGSGGDSSSGDNTPARSKLLGKAIDGYVVGATVFLDVNFSGELDNNEPYTTTTEGGDYNLTLDGEFSGCEQYAPIVTHVPVGAIDEDLGDVTEAYNMTTPPTYSPITKDDLLNITPLTSLVWNSINIEEDYPQLKAKNCQELKQNQDTFVAIEEKMKQEEKRIAEQYNITVDDIYSDYIADDNTELQAHAEGIVLQLQAVYAHTAVLKKQYPNAFVGVTITHTDLNEFVRQSEIFPKEGLYKSFNDLLNPDNLHEVIRNVGYTTRTTEEISGMNFYQKLEWQSAYDGKNPSCIKGESINDEPTYIQSTSTIEISNSITVQGAATANDCKDVNFTVAETNRKIFMHDRSVKEYEEANFWQYGMNGHLFDNGLFMNMAGKVGNSITIGDFDALPFELDPGAIMTPFGANSYASLIREGSPDKQHIITSWNSTGYKEIKTISENGTWKITCSTTSGETGSDQETCAALSSGH